MKGKHIKTNYVKQATLWYKLLCIIMTIALLGLMIPHGLVANAEIQKETDDASTEQTEPVQKEEQDAKAQDVGEDYINTELFSDTTNNELASDKENSENADIKEDVVWTMQKIAEESGYSNGQIINASTSYKKQDKKGNTYTLKVNGLATGQNTSKYYSGEGGTFRYYVDSTDTTNMFQLDVPDGKIIKSITVNAWCNSTGDSMFFNSGSVKSGNLLTGTVTPTPKTEGKASWSLSKTTSTTYNITGIKDADKVSQISIGASNVSGKQWRICAIGFSFEDSSPTSDYTITPVEAAEGGHIDPSSSFTVPADASYSETVEGDIHKISFTKDGTAVGSTITATPDTENGYYFKEWKIEKTKQFNDYSPVEGKITSNTSFTPVFEKDNVATYDPDKGQVTDAPEDWNYDEAAGVYTKSFPQSTALSAIESEWSDATLQKDGHVFDSWQSDADLGQITLSKDTKWTAKWIAVSMAPRVNASDLNTGDKVIIVCPNGYYPKEQTNTNAALGANVKGSKNYISPVAVTLEDSEGQHIAKWTDNAIAVATVSIIVDGKNIKYKFKTDDGFLSCGNDATGYLEFGNRYQNNEWVVNEDSESSSFTMNIDGFNRSVGYNISSGDRFDLYTGSSPDQQNINLSFYRTYEADPCVTFAADANGKIMDGNVPYVDSSSSKDVAFKKGESINVNDNVLTIPDATSEAGIKTLEAVSNDENYEFDKWMDEFDEEIAPGDYVINKGKTFKATFKEVIPAKSVLTFTGDDNILSFSIGEQSIVKGGTYEVTTGDSVSFKVNTNEHYLADTVTATDTITQDGDTYTIDSVSRPQTINATSKIEQHSLTFNKGEGISKFTMTDKAKTEIKDPVVLDYDASFSFKVETDKGYENPSIWIDDASDNPLTPTEDGIYTVENVVVDHAINSSATVKTYQLTFSSEEGIEGFYKDGEKIESPVTVNYNESFSFTVSVDEGYMNPVVKNDGSIIKPEKGDVYTVANIKDNHDITASAAKVKTAKRVNANDVKDGDKVFVVSPSKTIGDTDYHPALGTNNDRKYLNVGQVELSEDASTATWSDDTVVEVTVNKFENPENPGTYLYQFKHGEDVLKANLNKSSRYLYFGGNYKNDTWKLSSDGATFQILALDDDTWSISYNYNGGNARYNVYNTSGYITELSFYKFTENIPTVTFAADSDGKIMDGEEIYVDSDQSQDASFNEGSTITLDGSNLTIPDGEFTKTLIATGNDGYEFDKWVDNQGVELSNGEYKINNDMTFKATFKEIPEPVIYSITYDKNGATSGSDPGAQTKKEGETIYLAQQGDLLKTGYTYKGWNTQADASGVHYDAGSAYSDDANLALFAEWSPNTNTPYKVEHYKEKLDGTYNPSPDEVDNLEGTTDTELTPAVKSYTGFTAPTPITVKIAADGSTVVKYKYQRKSYSVIFDVKGHGTAPATQNIKYEGKVTEPEAPSAQGFAFDGWYKETECVNAWNFDTDIITSGTYIYAKWIETVSLSGHVYVKDSSPLEPIEGVEVVFTPLAQNALYKAVTDSTGYYMIDGIPKGQAGVLTFTKDGFVIQEKQLTAEDMQTSQRNEDANLEKTNPTPKPDPQPDPGKESQQGSTATGAQTGDNFSMLMINGIAVLALLAGGYVLRKRLNP